MVPCVESLKFISNVPLEVSQKKFALHCCQIVPVPFVCD